MKPVLRCTALIVFTLLLSCESRIKHTDKSINSNAVDNTAMDINGNYVSDFYAQRNEGYDWVAVSVKKNSPDEIFLSVRSRADKKKPTCTFDTKAYKINDSTYVAVEEGKKILQFNSMPIQ